MPQQSSLPHDLLFRTTSSRSTSMNALQEFVDVTSPSLARQVCIVRWGDQTYCLGGAREHVTDRIRERLQHICREPDFVMNHIVVGRSSGSLKPAMRYKQSEKSI
jgi:hypothetical protein